MPADVSDVRADIPPSPDAWLYLEEITHRTLNEYAAMVAMLRLASTRTTDVIGLDTLNAVARRLQATAAAYGALRPRRDAAPSNLEDDLEQLCVSLTTSFLADRSIKLTLSAEHVALSTRRSWQISLIVSELIMNAVKHAFAKLSSGAIVVDVQTDGITIRCTIMDDGVGDVNSIPGCGSGIVDALAADLGGTIVRRFSRTGSTVVLCAPIA